MLYNKSKKNKKVRYGQNFLVNETLAKLVVSSLDIQSGDIIVELGPGKGILTKYIVKGNSKVYLIEIDEKLCKNLSLSIIKDSKKVKIINEDYCKVDINSIVESSNLVKVKFISSTPFYLSKKILEDLLEKYYELFDSVILILQKELTISLIKSKIALGRYLSTFYKITVLFNIDKDQYSPSPKVDTCVVEIIKINNTYKGVIVIKEYYLVLKDLYNYKRKKIRNNKSLLKYNVDDIFKLYGEKRIEELTNTDVEDIYNKITRL